MGTRRGVSRFKRAGLVWPALFAVSGSAAFAYAVYGAIAAKYAALGGQQRVLGAPLSDEADAPYGGRSNRFQNGHIYWHRETNAFATWGEIDRKWGKLGRVAYGYPITDELASGTRGRFNDFRAIHLAGKPESSIYWTAQTGAHAIYGAIRAKWVALGRGRSALGFPTRDEVADGNFRRSSFEHGFIRWSPNTGTEAILTSLEGPRPGTGFASLPVVNGMAIVGPGPSASGTTVVFQDDLLFTHPELCARLLNQSGLNDQLRTRLVDGIRRALPRGVRLGIHSQTNHRLGIRCSARAVLTPYRVALVIRVPGNRLFVRLTTPDGVPGNVDPNFVINYDLVLTATIDFPRTPAGKVKLGTVRATAENISHPQSNSVTGAYIADLVAALLRGPGFSDALQQGGSTDFTGVGGAIDELNAAIARLNASSLAGARFESLARGGLHVLELTTRPPAIPPR